MGEKEAFEQAVLQHRAKLKIVARALTRHSHEVDDLVQQTYVHALRFWDKFQSGTNLQAWLCTILRNIFINGYRHKQRERVMLQTEGIETVFGHSCGDVSGAADETGMTNGLSDVVVTALSGLSPDFREAVTLVDLKGLSYREAAEIMKCPIGTVMSRLHRGRASLQEVLRPHAVAVGIIRRVGEEPEGMHPDAETTTPVTPSPPAEVPTLGSVAEVLPPLYLDEFIVTSDGLRGINDFQLERLRQLLGSKGREFSLRSIAPNLHMGYPSKAIVASCISGARRDGIVRYANPGTGDKDMHVFVTAAEHAASEAEKVSKKAGKKK